MSESLVAPPPPSKAALWTARVIGTLTVLFLAFDAVGKYFRPQPVVEAFARLGVPISLASTIGTLLLVPLVLYVIPQTRILGAILLSGYLGGAIAVNLRAADPPFETIFPALVGILVWLPLYLVDARVRALIPLTRSR